MKRLWMLSLAAAVALAGCARHAPINPYDQNAGYLVIDGELAYVGDEIAYGATVALDPAYLNSPGQYTFSIRAVGTPIRLTGDPLVAIEAESEESAFSVAGQPEASLGSGDVTQFVIEFAPSSVGVQSATVTIEVNDRPEVAFTFDVEAEGRTSAIVIEEGDVEYAPGGTCDLGSLPLGVTHSVLLTILNKAAYAVELTGDPVVAITGDDAGAFTVIDEPTGTELSSGGSAAFSLGFTPSAERLHRATLSIETDGRADFPFTLQLEAEGSGSAIAIEEGTNDYLSGDTFDFGGPLPPGASESVILRIRNNADNDIELTGDPVVAITGQDATAFTVTDEPDSTELDSGYSTTFTLEFAPTEPGTYSAAVSIEIGGVPAAYALDLAGALSGAVLVDTAGEIGDYASICCSGTNVWISYYDATDDDLEVARSADSGGSWSTTTVDSTDNVGTGTSIFTDGSEVYVAYRDITNSDVKAAKSTLSGTEWLPTNITVVGTYSYGSFTDIAVSGSDVYVSHQYGFGGIRVAHSADSGASWPTSLTVDSEGAYGTIAVNGATVYLSYYDESTDDLEFAVSTDSAESWPSAPVAVASTGDVGRYSSIVLSGSEILIAYCGYYSVRLARSSDGGSTWSNQDIYAEASTSSAVPSMHVDGETVRVCFDDAGSVILVTSADGGATWGEPLTIVSPDASGPCLAAEGDMVYICYYDEREGDLGFVVSSDGGDTWW